MEVEVYRIQRWVKVPPGPLKVESTEEKQSRSPVPGKEGAPRAETSTDSTSSSGSSSESPGAAVSKSPDSASGHSSRAVPNLGTPETFPEETSEVAFQPRHRQLIAEVWDRWSERDPIYDIPLGFVGTT